MAAQSRPIPRGYWIVLAIFVLFAFSLIGRSDPAFLPEIRTFLDHHPEFGRPLSKTDIPDWAFGKRQRVRFSTGRDLLFYVRAGQVITVYEDGGPEGRTKIWGEYAQ